MGSFSYLYISEYPILSEKSGYIHGIVDLLFQEDDYTTYTRNLKDRSSAVWGDSYMDDEGNEQVICFRSTAAICKERLEIYGVNKELVKNEFETLKEYFIEENKIEKHLFENVNFDSYLNEIRHIIKNKLTHIDEHYTSLSEYLQFNELFIENQSIALGLYIIMSCVDDEAVIEYDLTDIINSGDVEYDEIPRIINKEKVIILTEGKTDSEFLKNGIELFYNHLKDYYHFMDFESSKYESNASRLVQTVKAFVGSGIQSKMIAIFDNDTASRQEMENLRKIKLPYNIKILRYPDTELARNYPTIGPTGKQNIDVNGLAGCIELYLGTDILMDNGQYIPIQWTGYMDKVGSYQGELQRKGEIQNRFRAKVQRFNKSSFISEDWMELNQIIKILRFG